MRHATIWGRELAMQGSPITLLHYRREFGSDLQDDLVEAYTGGGNPLPCLVRVLWAMCATVDPGISHYEQWLGEFPAGGFDLKEPVAGVIDSAIAAELFRRGKTGRAARARRWLARRLGSLSRRLDA